VGFAFAAELLVLRSHGQFATAMNIPFIKNYQPSLLIGGLLTNPWTYLLACCRSLCSWRWWWCFRRTL